MNTAKTRLLSNSALAPSPVIPRAGWDEGSIAIVRELQVWDGTLTLPSPGIRERNKKTPVRLQATGR